MPAHEIQRLGVMEDAWLAFRQAQALVRCPYTAHSTQEADRRTI